MTKEEADKLREEGNALYRIRDFPAAIKKYLNASKVCPENDSSPLSNVSAAFYENGQYELSIAFGKRALDIMNVISACNTTMQSEDITEKIKNLEARISRAEELLNKVGEPERRKRREDILERLQRYHANMRSASEYNAVGYDDAKPLFDHNLASVYPNSESSLISFFSAGLGDARHFFATLIGIAHYEKANNQIQQKRKYHFTLVDINNHVLARDLIFFTLLDKISHSDTEDSDSKLLMLTTLYFVYINPIMPKCVSTQLQQIISELLDKLRNSQQPLEWVHLRNTDMQHYILALERWHADEGPCDTFPISQVFDEVQQAMRKSQGNLARNELLLSSLSPACIKERQLYSTISVIYPPDRIIQLHDKKILELQKLSSPGLARKDFRELVHYVLSSGAWEVNPTFYDANWHGHPENTKPRMEPRHDPFDLVERFSCELKNALGDRLPRPGSDPKLFDCIKPLFEAAAEAINHLRGRLVVEVICGDYIDVAEQIHFGLSYDSKDTEPHLSIPRPTDFPTLYDRVHLSNVPDSVGGHLTTFLHAMPLLKQLSSSYLTSVCLRNGPAFRKMTDFLAEYQHITSEDMLTRLTNVTITFKGDPPVPLADYTFYRWANTSTNPKALKLQRPVTELMPRTELTRWVHSIFWKLAIPFQIEYGSPLVKVIYSPLNFLTLFNKILHLHTLGYPIHWLSETLLPLLSATKTLTTTTRPPRRIPLRPEYIKSHKYTSKELCIAPFAAEIKLLATLFAPLLPFRIPQDLLYKETDIYEYTVNLSPYDAINPQSACLALIFRNPELNPNGLFNLETEQNLRPLLDPSWGDEESENGDYRGRSYEEWREKEVLCFGVFAFDANKGEAKIWMEKQLVEEMVKKEWVVGLWRRDTGGVVGNPEFVVHKSVKDLLVRGRKWSGADVEVEEVAATLQDTL